MSNIPSSQVQQVAPNATGSMTGLKVMCGVVGIVAMITSAVQLIEPNRRFGTTEFPNPALAFGAAIGAILIPAVIAFVVSKAASNKAGLLTFMVLAAVVTLLSLAAIANTWSYKF